MRSVNTTWFIVLILSAGAAFAIGEYFGTGTMTGWLIGHVSGFLSGGLIFSQLLKG